MAYRFPAHTVDPTRHSQEFIAWHKKAKPGHSREEDGMTWTKHEDGSLSVSRPGKEKKAMLSAFADELEKHAPGRDDLRTIFDRIDFDDYVSFHGRA